MSQRIEMFSPKEAYLFGSESVMDGPSLIRVIVLIEDYSAGYALIAHNGRPPYPVRIEQLRIIREIKHYEEIGGRIIIKDKEHCATELDL